MNLFTSIAVAAVTVVAAAFPAAATTIKVATNVAESSNWVAGANRFKELVEERSQGRISVKVYPNGVLSGGNDRVELEMAQAGAIEMIMKSTPWLAQLDDRFMVVGMPWIFPDQETAMAVMDGPVGEELSSILKEKQLHPLAWGSGSFFQLYTNAGPIKAPEDVSGMKIRTPGLELYLDSWKATGAVPVALSFAEVFSALQAGAIDGGISPIPLIYSSRFFEVSKYISVVNFSFEAIGLLASDSFWTSLDEEDQKLVRQAAIEGMAYQRELAASQEAEYVGEMEKAGVKVHVPAPAELDLFKAKVEPIFASYREKIGAEFVDKVIEQVSAAGN